MTYLNIIDQIMILAAGVKGDAQDSPLVDNEYVAEVVAPHAVQLAIDDMVKTGRNIDDIIQEHTISMTAGVGTLPATVIKSWIKQATLIGRQFASWLPYPDFQRYKYSNVGQLDYFTVNGNNIYFKEAGTTDYTGNITLRTPSTPTIPSDPDDEITIPERLVKAWIAMGAAILRGEIPLPRTVDGFEMKLTKR